MKVKIASRPCKHGHKVAQYATGVLALLLALSLIVGCAKKGPATGGAAGKVTVGIVSPALVSVFHQTVVKGAKEQAKVEGWEVASVAPEKESDFARQVAMIEDLIQNNVKAISICAIDDKAIVGAVKKANAAGIPVFIHNSLTEIPAGAEVTAYIGYDQRDGGRKCGEEAVKLLTAKYGKPKGNIAIIQGISGFHTKERSGGFMEVISKYPDIKKVADQPADWDRNKAVDVTENILQSHKDIDLIFGCSDAMAQGASAAAERAGKKVFTIGIDGNPDAIADVKSGKLTATLATNPKEIGKTIIKSMKDKMDGKTVPKIVKTETTIVDKTNVDKFGK